MVNHLWGPLYKRNWKTQHSTGHLALKITLFFKKYIADGVDMKNSPIWCCLDLSDIVDWHER